MSRPTIVYLHGFRSSPSSVKARQLGAAVAALPKPLRPALHVPTLEDRPALAIAAILERTRDADRDSLTFVGSSLGGFYATHAAERLGARAVLINPAVRPYDDLLAHRGRQANLYTGAMFDVTDDHFREWRALAVAAITRPSRYWLLVQTGDEVLDYRQAIRFYAGAWQYVQGGGDHSYAGFDAVIGAVLRFGGVSGEGAFVRRN